MDVHIPRAITEGLRLRAINVLTAQEDEMAQADDPILLDRAGELDRLLVTQDTDFLVEADRRARANKEFRSIIYAPQIGVSFGKFIDDLEIVAHVAHDSETSNTIFYIPL
jgi:hypothetical protein